MKDEWYEIETASEEMERALGETEKLTKPYAVFIGNQETPEGSIPLFNIIGGKRDGSTVTLKTLQELKIEVKDEKEN